MTLRYDYDEPIEQILFGPNNKGGLGVRQWSLGLSDREVDLWAERLGKYNRLSPIFVQHRSWVPPRALSYFEFRDRTAALLTRFNNVESGRNSSHALIGSVATLGYYAMSMSEWEGWRTEDPGARLPSLTQRVWQHCLSRWTDTVRVGAGDRRPALTALIREILLGEADHLTVLLDADPLPLLTLAREVLDPVLSFPGGRFGWTFSTYEASDTDPEASPHEDGAPRFWCLRSLPASGQTYRHRVRLDQGIEDDRYSNLAYELVAGYFKEPDRFSEILADKLSAITDRESRVVRLLDEYGTAQPFSQPAAIAEQVPVGGYPAPPAATRQPAEHSSSVPLESRQLIRELSELSQGVKAYHVNVLKGLDDVGRQLRIFQWVLMIAVGVLLVAVLVFVTAR